MERKPLFKQYWPEAHIRSKITVILFCCSVLVIYIHAFNLATYQISSDASGMGKLAFWAETAVATLNKFAVPIFFMLSGFLYYRNFSSNVIWKKMKNRARTILLPYVIWCSLYYLLFALCAMIPFIRAAMNSKSNEGITFAGWIRSLWVDEYYTLWFLKRLILFILLSPVIFVLLKNNKHFHNGTITLLIIVVLSLTPFGKSFLPGSLPEYLLGCYVGLNIKEIAAWKPPKQLTHWALALLPVLLIISYFCFNVIIEAAFLVFAWIGLDAFEEIQTHWWMEITFFTYVSHDFLLEAIEKIIFKLLPQTPLIALLDYLFVPIIIEVILIAVAYVMIRKMLPLWNILTGSRKIEIPERKL